MQLHAPRQRGVLLAPVMLAILVAHAALAARVTALQQPTASPPQTTAETPWPPVGVFRPDARSGVTTPRPIDETKPILPGRAYRANVQGTVVMEAVVQPDGTVGDVRVVRSLDKQFGVDDAAVTALKRWRFAPGKKDGVAVPVLVEVEMTFAISRAARRVPD